jgi:hypothetical protein
MDEMVGDTMDMLEDEEGLEDEADEQVEKVLWEITDGKLGQAGKVRQTELPVIVCPSTKQWCTRLFLTIRFSLVIPGDSDGTRRRGRRRRAAAHASPTRCSLAELTLLSSFGLSPLCYCLFTTTSSHLEHRFVLISLVVFTIDGLEQKDACGIHPSPS